jgi:hypothetical protein
MNLKLQFKLLDFLSHDDKMHKTAFRSTENNMSQD